MPDAPRKLIVANAARADLVEIATYTAETWGEEQRNRYVRGISETIRACCETTGLGPKVKVIWGHRRVRYESHYIYFQIEDDTLTVTRVLHVRMDPEAHLED